VKRIFVLLLVLSLIVQIDSANLAVAASDRSIVAALDQTIQPELPSAIVEETQQEVLTLEQLSTQFQLPEIKLLEQLNKGYTLAELYAALQSMNSEEQLEEILHQLNPGVRDALQRVDYSTERFEGAGPIRPEIEQEASRMLTLGEQVETTPIVIIPDEQLFNPSVTSSVYGGVEGRINTLASSSYPTTYDDLAIKRLDIKADQAPFSISGLGENISTVSGALSTQSIDMVLPGRNGLSFALTRTYNSADAQYYDKKLYHGAIYTTRYYPELTGRLYYKYPDFMSVGNLGSASNFYFIPSVYQSFVQFVGDYRTIYYPSQYPIMQEFNNEVYDSFKSSWRYVDPDIKNSPVFFAVENLTLYNTPLIARYYTTGNIVIDPFVNSQVVGLAYGNQTQLKQEDTRFPLGKGWKWDLPYIETKDSKQYLHLFGGSTYELNGLQLKGYPWQDLTLSYKNTVTVNNKQSTYELKSLDGRKLYFANDGYLIQISDSYNNTIQFEYQNVSPYGLVLSKVRDALGNEMSITYTANEVRIVQGDRVVKYDKIKDPQNNKELLSQVTDPLGRKTQYVYEIASTPFDIVGYGRMKDNYTALLKQVYHPTKARTDYTYQAFNRSLGNSGAQERVYRTTAREDVVTYTDGSVAKSNRVDYSYNGDGATVQRANTVFSTTVNNGRTSTTYAYDRIYIDDNTPEQYYNTQITVSDGSEQQITAMTYNRAQNRPVPIQTTSYITKGGMQSTAVTTSNTYDDYGNVLTATDPMNRTTTYTYDTTTHLLSSISVPVRTGLNLYTELHRYSNTNGLQMVRLKENNANGTLMGQTSFVYDAYGNPTNVMLKDDNRDITVTQEYDYTLYKAGFLTKHSAQVTDASNQNTTVTQQMKYSLATGELTEHTDGKGYVTRYEYDKLGRATKVIYPDLSQVVLSYDDQNNQATAIDETGVTQRIQWNPLGLKVAEGIVGKGTSRYGYDAFSRLVWSEDGAGNRMTYTYNAWDQLVRTDLPGGNNAFSAVVYDDINRTVQTTDPEGNVSKGIFDLLGRTTRQEARDPSGALVSKMDYTYDFMGNVLTQVDGRGSITSFAYDVLSRLVAVTDPENQTTQYAYSLAGNLKEVRYPGNQGKVVKRYDQMGHLIQQTDPAGQIDTYAYDANSNLIQKTDRAGQVQTYNYNNRNQQISSSTANETITYGYDQAGRRLSMQDGLGTTYFGYEPATGWLKTVTYPDQRQTQYTYDNQGIRTQMIDPFGVVTKYQYNARNELAAVGTTPTQWDAQYTYKKNGLRATTHLLNVVTATFGYNELNLTSLTHTRTGGMLNSFAYGYDQNRNQISKTENSQSYTYGYDTLNRILSSTQLNEEYTYDPRGNRQTLQTDALLDMAEINYQYDNRNRLMQVNRGINPAVQYLYNGDGLLSERTEAGVTTRYYYDGEQIIAEGIVSGGGVTHKASYIRGNELVARVDASGSKAYYGHNGHGDVVNLIDSSGQVLNSYTYDMWGNPLAVQEIVDNPFRYSGEYWDDSTGLQYLRARWYDPSIGRFISEDTYEGELNNPLSLNLYTYVYNNPLIFIDPTGNVPKWVKRVIADVVVVSVRGGQDVYNGSKSAYQYLIGDDIDVMLDPNLTYAEKKIAEASFQSNFIPGAGQVAKIPLKAAAKEAAKQAAKQTVTNASTNLLKGGIKHNLYNDLKKQFGSKGRDRFVTAMNKGVVRGAGENGVKFVGSSHNGKGVLFGNTYYKYEVKLVGGPEGDWRLLGNWDEKSGQVIYNVMANHKKIKY